MNTGKQALLVSMLACQLAVAGDTTEYILGSRVNVREAPDRRAKIVASVPIGTQVRRGPAEREWCRISLSGNDRYDGYAVCELITAERPTLEQIDKDLARPGLERQHQNDLLERRFYLSPSLNTIALARERNQLPAEDRWPDPAFPWSSRSGEGDRDNSKKSAAPGQVLSASLIDAFRGDVTGNDFRPVDLHANEVAVEDVAAFVRALHEKAFGSSARYVEQPTGAFPPIRSSLFQDSRDVLVLGHLPSNLIEHSAPPFEVYTPNDPVEFSKVYPGQRLNVRHTELVARRHEAGSLNGWNRTGGVDVRFAIPPRAVVISRNRAFDAKLVSVHVRLSAHACQQQGVRPQIAKVEPMQKLFAGGPVLVLSPKIRIADVKRMGTTVNPAVYDLDGDGIADLAETRFASDAEMGYPNNTLAVFVNIQGSWRLAFQQLDSYCD